MEYRDINNWLEDELNKLDISPTNYKRAVDRYTAVGTMIEDRLKSDYNIDCHIYAQGSFMIGTVIKPFGRDKEYDVDLVCECDIDHAKVSPKELKHLIGKIMREDSTYGKMLCDEGRRTWTIEYAEDNDLSFHIDIQPSIPKLDIVHKQAILTTTRLKTDFSKYRWDNGNPLGFKDWFSQRNSIAYESIKSFQKRKLFEENIIYNSLDDIPDQLVKTGLQRLIQILKRHRDIRFEGHEYSDDKPNSMIISILATKVFEDTYHTISLYELLKEFSNKLMENITALQRCHDDLLGLLINRINGKYEINNPTIDENLAERWNDNDNNKKQAFFDWVKWISADIDHFTLENILDRQEYLSFDNAIKKFTAAKINSNFKIYVKPKEIVNTSKPWKYNV